MKRKILWVLTALPLVATCAVLPFLPEQIPAHYDLAGEVDRWGSKFESLIFPAVIVLLGFVWFLVLRSAGKKCAAAADDKARAAAVRNEKVFLWAALGTTVILCALQIVSLITAARGASSSTDSLRSLTIFFLGLLLVLFGLLMPKTKRNGAFGLRTHWSMKNDRAWKKSNRLGGIVMVICGLLVVLLSAVLPGALAGLAALGVLLLDVIVSVICSFIAGKNEPEEPEK